MRKNKIEKLIGVSLGVILLGISLIGCNGTTNLNQSIVITDNVKADATESSLKIISQKEYAVEQNKYIDQYTIINNNNELFVSSLAEESIGEENLSNMNYAIEKLVFEDEKIKKIEVESGSIYSENVIWSVDGIYNWEVMSNNKVRVYNPLNKHEIMLDYNKLKESGFFREGESHNYTLRGNNLTEIIYSKDKTQLVQLNWFNIKDYNTGTINVPQELNLIYTSDNINNKIHYVASTTGDKFYGNSVGVIDLDKNTIESPVEIELGDEEKFDILSLDEDTVLLGIYNETYDISLGRDLKLKTLDLKNKTIKDIATIKNCTYMMFISPNKNKIFYEQVSDGKNQIVTSILKNDEIQGKCVIYEYDLNKEIPRVTVSEDGKEIIIGLTKYGEKVDSDDPQTYHGYYNLQSVIKVILNK